MFCSLVCGVLEEYFVVVCGVFCGGLWCFVVFCSVLCHPHLCTKSTITIFVNGRTFSVINNSDLN